MNRFENREGNNLNRKVLEVEKVTRDGTGEILSLEVKVIRGDDSIEKVGTPVESDSFNTIVKGMIKEGLYKLGLTDKQKNQYQVNNIEIGFEVIDSDTIVLPAFTEDNLDINWSCKEVTITQIENGEVTEDRKVFIVTRTLEKDIEVKLIATVGSGEDSARKEFNVKVLKKTLTDLEKASLDRNNISIQSVVEDDLYLPTRGTYGSEISWGSSNNSVISINGAIATVFKQNEDVEVTLTATITLGSESLTKDFNVTVKAITDEERVNKDTEKLNILKSTTESFALLTNGTYGSTISWSSSKNSVISINGSIATVYRQNEDVKITLTAKIKFNNVERTKTFEVTVIAKTPQEKVEECKNYISKNLLRTVTDTLVLPQPINGVGATWSSSSDAITIIANSATVNRRLDDTNVTLTVELEYENAYTTFNAVIEVKGLRAEYESIAQADLDSLNFQGELKNNYSLVRAGSKGSQFTYSISEGAITINNNTLVNSKTSVQNATLTVKANYKGIEKVKEFAITVKAREKTSQEKVQEAKEALSIPTRVTQNIGLPLEGKNGCVISWSSSDNNVIKVETNIGIVTRGTEDKNVELTATIEIENTQVYDTKSFIVTVVKRERTDLEKAESDRDNISIPSLVEDDFYLPTRGTYGSEISWSSSDNSVISISGSYASVTRSYSNEYITLTATITLGSESLTKDFNVTVQALEEPEPEPTVTYTINNQYLMWSYDSSSLLSGTMEVEFTNGSGSVEVTAPSHIDVTVTGNKTTTVTITISENSKPDLTLNTIFDIVLRIYDNEDNLLGNELGQISYEGEV